MRHRPVRLYETQHKGQCNSPTRVAEILEAKLLRSWRTAVHRLEVTSSHPDLEQLLPLGVIRSGEQCREDLLPAGKQEEMALTREERGLAVWKRRCHVPGHGRRGTGILIAVPEMDLDLDIFQTETPRLGQDLYLPGVTLDTAPGRLGIAGHQHLPKFCLGEQNLIGWGIVGCVLCKEPFGISATST